MAVNNRTEAQSAVTSDIVATVTNTIHRTLLNDKILNSVVFEKDIIASETPSAGAVTIDYSNKDTATVTTAVDLAVSFSNLENGAIKYLEVTKAATNVISFVGASDHINFRDYINTVETVVVYRISNKNGVIYIEALFAPDSTSFQSLTLNTTYFSGYAKYRTNKFSGKIEIEIEVTCILVATGEKIATLNSTEIPDRNVYFTLTDYLGVADPKIIPCRIGVTTGNIIADNGEMTAGRTYFAYFEYYKSLP